MVAEILAQDVYELAVEQLQGFRESTFLSENPEFVDLAEGFGEIVQFLIGRPAMLVDDFTKPEKLIEYMFEEVTEAEHAETHGSRDDYIKELGDCGFFGLLVGGLFWDTLSVGERDSVVNTLRWSQAQAKEKGIDLDKAIVEVARGKNVTNYRVELHQLTPGESVDNVRARVPKIRELHRDLREKLNGEWAESIDLLSTLAHYWLNRLTSEEPVTVKQIEALFTLAGIDLLEYADN